MSSETYDEIASKLGSKIERIHIFGSCGSGKTTLGKVLSQATASHLYQLDDIFWLYKHRFYRNREQRDHIFKLVSETKSWVTEGNQKSDALNVFLDRADLLIWLAMPYEHVLPNLLLRNTLEILENYFDNPDEQILNLFSYTTGYVSDRDLYLSESATSKKSFETAHFKTHLRWYEDNKDKTVLLTDPGDFADIIMAFYDCQKKHHNYDF